jgi:hypothetical protein
VVKKKKLLLLLKWLAKLQLLLAKLQSMLAKLLKKLLPLLLTLLPLLAKLQPLLAKLQAPLLTLLPLLKLLLLPSNSGQALKTGLRAGFFSSAFLQWRHARYFPRNRSSRAMASIRRGRGWV